MANARARSAGFVVNARPRSAGCASILFLANARTRSAGRASILFILNGCAPSPFHAPAAAHLLAPAAFLVQIKPDLLLSKWREQRHNAWTQVVEECDDPDEMHALINEFSTDGIDWVLVSKVCNASLHDTLRAHALRVSRVVAVCVLLGGAPDAHGLAALSC